MLASHISAETKYREYRAEVFKSVKQVLNYPDSNLINLRDIDTAALVQARLWEQLPERQVDFNWEQD